MTVDARKCRMTLLQVTSRCKLCSQIYIAGAVHNEKPLTNMARGKTCILKGPTTNFRGTCFLYFNVKCNHAIATEEETP